MSEACAVILRADALPLLLIPNPFTVAEAQAVFEAVPGGTLDPANVRRKLMAQNILDEAGRRQAIGPPTRTWQLRPDIELLFRRPLLV